VKALGWKDPGFARAIEALERRGEAVPEGVEDKVRAILADVAARGDQAVVEHTRLHDGVDLARIGIEITPSEIAQARDTFPGDDLALLKEAAASIRDFHTHQLEKTWTFSPAPGVILGQKVTPLARVGIYVPGGTAAYPSSVLMNAVPARVAGVGEVVMTVPTPRGVTNPAVLAAAALAGVDRVFRVGGAQAVGALAHGTATIPRVDKIVGPGNIWVATAKRLVFGLVDIDMVAGPSEILVIADKSADPALVAADLLSQAEHDPLAYPLLVTDSAELLAAVRAEVERQLRLLPRREIALASWNERGHLFLAPDLAEAARMADRLAVEHLELFVADPQALLPSINNAGAIFLGGDTPEALGDYLAGPNHVLPTGGTARFSSPLGVYDFLKKSSLIGYSREALGKRAAAVARFARLEGLEAHARAVEMRAERKR
jgi:histidinol dehydrogenase